MYPRRGTGLRRRGIWSHTVDCCILFASDAATHDAFTGVVRALAEAAPVLLCAILFCALWAYLIYKLAKWHHATATAEWKAVTEELRAHLKVALDAAVKRKHT
jgi:hypothetical protein